MKIPALKFTSRPCISLVVVVYRMPDQAKNTLYSLSINYQRNVSQADYEVIVVENASDRLLGKNAASKHGKNFRYYLREDNSVSPVNAVNYGVQKARGEMVGIMIDGARLVTPGIVQYVLAARRITKQALVSVPGYHLGYEPQAQAVLSDYDEKAETELLESIDWPKDGYRLFDIACFSASSENGLFHPINESNCFCMPKHMYESTGGCDARFESPGGGFVNLDLYKRICEIPDTTLFMLIGEGNFHQFHGGITTGDRKNDAWSLIVQKLHDQYVAIRGEDYSPPMKKPVYLGEVHASAMNFIHQSAGMVMADKSQ
jgi:glycosyltransferase involved in cell wall biosynthesis